MLTLIKCLVNELFDFSSNGFHHHHYHYHLPFTTIGRFFFLSVVIIAKLAIANAVAPPQTNVNMSR